MGRLSAVAPRAQYVFACNTSDAVREWLKTLQQATRKDPGDCDITSQSLCSLSDDVVAENAACTQLRCVGSRPSRRVAPRDPTC